MVRSISAPVRQTGSHSAIGSSAPAGKGDFVFSYLEKDCSDPEIQFRGSYTHNSQGLKRSSVALRHNDNTRAVLNHRLAMSMRKCSHPVGIIVICEIAR